jgi:hypothetical protein
VLFLSETEMECCVPLCGVRKPMSWVCRSLRDGDETMCTPVRGEGAHVMGLLFSFVQRVEMM